MELAFSAGTLGALDTSSADVIACGLFEDDRPMRGLAAVVDYRLAGRMHGYVRRGELTGVADEAFLFPPRPRLGAEKLVVFGWGKSSELDEAASARAVDRLVRTLVGLGAKRAVVELPGRTCGILDAELAATLFFRSVEEHGADFTFLLIEDDEGKKRFAARIEEEKKRARRVM